MHHFQKFLFCDRTAGVFVYRKYTITYVFLKNFNCEIKIMMHFWINFTSVRLQFDFSSTSVRLQFDFSSTSVQLQFNFSSTSVPFQSTVQNSEGIAERPTRSFSTSITPQNTCPLFQRNGRAPQLVCPRYSSGVVNNSKMMVLDRNLDDRQAAWTLFSVCSSCHYFHCEQTWKQSTIHHRFQAIHHVH